MPFWLKGLCAVALVALLIAGALFYRHYQGVVRKHVEEELQAITRLKVNQIAEWRANQLGEARELIASHYLIERFARWLAVPQAEVPGGILNRLRAIQGHYKYADVVLVDAECQPRFSLSGRVSPLAAEVTRSCNAALCDGQPVLTDLHMAPITAAPQIAVIAPLLTGGLGTQERLGAVILVSDARKSLYPLVQSWPTVSATAETLLIRPEGPTGLCLNDLRHRPGAALDVRFPSVQTNQPAALAALGREGVMMGKDYRGIEVVADIKHVPGAPWYMVTKVDVAEAFAAWRFSSVLILSLLVGLPALFSVAMLVFWQRHQKAYYHALYLAELTQRASERRHSVTLESIGEAIVVTDAESRVELLNRVAETLTGWKNQEARGKPLEQIVRILNEETRQPVENLVQRVLRQGIPEGEINHSVLVARDGTERPIANCGTPIRDDQGKFTGVVLVFRDQTTERAARRAMQTERGLLRTLVDNLPVGVYVKDAAARTTLVNPLGARNLGVSTEAEALGKTDYDFFTREQAEAFYADDQQVLQTGHSVLNREELLTRPDGTQVWLLTSKVALRDAAGRITGLVGIGLDVTERKRAEEALRESEERYRMLVEESPDAIGIFQDGKLQFINATGVQRLGAKSKAELLGLGSASLIHPDDHAAALDRIRRRVGGETGVYPALVRYLCKDGTPLPVEVSAAPIVYRGAKDWGPSRVVDSHRDRTAHPTRSSHHLKNRYGSSHSSGSSR
jgi:PAS domain S-box-containing protein